MKINKGFNMIEVMIVISIVAILTVIAFPAINDIRAKNRDAERIADIATLQLNLSLYYNQHQNSGYPATLDALKAAGYTNNDIITSPDGSKYTYVPLNRGGGAKCTYYHLGTKLELPSAQIDTNDTFSSGLPLISNGYSYCGGYSGSGLYPPNIPAKQYNYNVHP